MHISLPCFSLGIVSIALKRSISVMLLSDSLCKGRHPHLTKEKFQEGQGGTDLTETFKVYLNTELTKRQITSLQYNEVNNEHIQ